MSFQFGQAHEVSLDQAATIGRALAKRGQTRALVVAHGIHAGQLALLRAAKNLRGAAVTFVLLDAPEGEPADLLRDLGVDAVVRISSAELFPAGPRTQIRVPDRGLEGAEDLSREVTALVALASALSASDVVVGEKDFEFAVAAQQAMTDLHLPVVVHSVPTVRMPSGLAVSTRNGGVAPEDRERALALSAALTAGAHVAERGAEAVLDTAGAVLAAAGVEPEYLELRGRDLSPLDPDVEEADARLLVAADIGGVRLIDSVGVPLGVGFKNLQG